MTVPDPFPLTRKQLQEFVPNHESIRRIERLFQVVNLHETKFETLNDELEFYIHATAGSY